MNVEWNGHAQGRFKRRVDPKRVDLTIVHPAIAESGLNRRVGEVWKLAVHGVVWVCLLKEVGLVRIKTCYPNRVNATDKRPAPKPVGVKTKNWRRRNRRPRIELEDEQ